jgi:hypothetical protein
MDSKTLRFVLLVALLAVPQALAAQPAPYRILFVGNSLTSTNDLPAMVASLPCFADGRPITFQTIAVPDSSLADHLKRGTLRAALTVERWDLVVLQQGPSALPASRKELLDSVAKLKPLIIAAGARPAMYMVWPSWQRRDDFDAVTESYRQAGAAIDALLLPVGEAWRAAWRREPGLPLYAGDELHASPLGSYLAAVVICSAIGGRPSADVAGPPVMNGKPLVLPRAHIDYAVASAAETLARFPPEKSASKDNK